MTALPQRIDSLIDGARVAGVERFTVHDRYTQAPVCEVAVTTREQVEQAVDVARRACAAPLPPYERAQILKRAAPLLEARRAVLVEAMVTEAGFTHADANNELTRALDTLELSAEEAKRLTGDMVPLDGNAGQHRRIGFTLRVPVGVVCAITPFNSPLNAVLHKVGPALAAGNAVVLKPSERTPITSSLMCDVLLEAGLPPAWLALVNGAGETGQALLEARGIDFYSFTGSTRVGQIIQAGARLRRTQLELGSIACTIVCADADLDAALPKIARAAFRKAGQVCTSIQRLYVDTSIADTFSHALARLAEAMPRGDPRDPATQVGPMITPGEAGRALGWIDEARAGGARVLCGGTREGAVIAPTVIVDAQPGMAVIDREIFAPVVCVLPFGQLDEALNDINAMPFGLSAGIFTTDIHSAFAAARTLRTGAVHINETCSSRVDSMPYGGVKDSGFGREGPYYSIREMTDERVVTISL
jgi:succinate-semialdehyde dehydrogenase/glutarate-semialdehyde dehydrogenase